MQLNIIILSSFSQLHKRTWLKEAAVVFKGVDKIAVRGKK